MEIGIDLEEVSKFDLKKNSPFIKRYFSKDEADYCFSHSNPKMHLAAFFCAKEAYRKTKNKYEGFENISINHTKKGKPYLCLNGKKIKEVKMSLSHTQNYAVAVVMRTK